MVQPVRVSQVSKRGQAPAANLVKRAALVVAAGASPLFESHRRAQGNLEAPVANLLPRGPFVAGGSRFSFRGGARRAVPERGHTEVKSRTWTVKKDLYSDRPRRNDSGPTGVPKLCLRKGTGRGRNYQLTVPVVNSFLETFSWIWSKPNAA